MRSPAEEWNLPASRDTSNVIGTSYFYGILKTENLLLLQDEQATSLQMYRFHFVFHCNISSCNFIIDFE